MRKLAVGLAFFGTLALGWVVQTGQAECRMCQQKRCSSDRSCGKHCTCVWPDGKDYKMGICVRMGD